MSKLEQIRIQLEKRKEQERFRQIQVISDEGEGMLSFASEDVLNLATHPYIKKSTLKYVLEWGVGSTASRLSMGHLACQQDVEEKLASLLGTESALLFQSGMEAIRLTLGTLVTEETMLFIDRGCHPRLIPGQGVKKRFEHLDYEDLSILLEHAPHNRPKIILTESLFYLSGAEANLRKLIALAKEHDAFLLVDDSAGVGVLGKHGLGACSCKRGVDLIIGSFNKASGSFGAFLGTSHLLREYLCHFAKTPPAPLPPAALGAASGALDLIPDMQLERSRILSSANKLRDQLTQEGFDLGPSSAHILPLILRAEEDVTDFFEALRQEKISVMSLRPPLVPIGTSRLRLTLTAKHTPPDLKRLLDTLQSAAVKI